MARNHELYVGERVYDRNTMLVMHVASINCDGSVDLEMTDDDREENIAKFDYSADEGYEKIHEENADGVYQFAEGVTDRKGNTVCLDHLHPDSGVYFSPYLGEDVFPEEME